MSRVFARHYPDMFFNLLSLVTKNVTTMPCLRHELELVGFTGVDHLTVWSPKNIEKKIRTDATFQPECCLCLFSNTYTILYYQTQNQQVNPSKTTRKNQQMNPSKKSWVCFIFFWQKHMFPMRQNINDTSVPAKVGPGPWGAIFFTTRGGGSAPKDGFNQWIIWWTTKMWIINGF